MDVYILGAGFSSDAGIPTMKNFMSGVDKVREVCSIPKERAVLIRALQYSLVHREDNIEKLISAVERLKKMPPWG
ncbi:MAG: hypothetical protein KGZ79_06545 [Dethiobacter sp.]|jgi:hypothetical protein|nr:hypothetical protein [Dethiobacter sp.]